MSWTNADVAKFVVAVNMNFVMCHLKKENMEFVVIISSVSEKLKWITEMFAHAPKPKWFAVVTSQPMKPSVRLMRNQLDEDRQLL